jgi:hypothetical protein
VFPRASRRPIGRPRGPPHGVIRVSVASVLSSQGEDGFQLALLAQVPREVHGSRSVLSPIVVASKMCPQPRMRSIDCSSALDATTKYYQPQWHWVLYMPTAALASGGNSKRCRGVCRVCRHQGACCEYIEKDGSSDDGRGALRQGACAEDVRR